MGTWLRSIIWVWEDRHITGWEVEWSNQKTHSGLQTFCVMRFIYLECICHWWQQLCTVRAASVIAGWIIRVFTNWAHPTVTLLGYTPHGITNIAWYLHLKLLMPHLLCIYSDRSQVLLNEALIILPGRNKLCTAKEPSWNKFAALFSCLPPLDVWRVLGFVITNNTSWICLLALATYEGKFDIQVFILTPTAIYMQ